ncbi:MAG: ComF family protein [Sphingobacteriia bacterium]|nr:ComF family protein [Sphingobacteriia bacterium]
MKYKAFSIKDLHIKDSFKFYFKIFSKAIDIIFPPKCLFCQKIILDHLTICSDCFKEIEFVGKNKCKRCAVPLKYDYGEEIECARCIESSPVYNKLHAIFYYGDYLKEAVHKFKYTDKTSYSKFFSTYMVRSISNEFKNFDYLTYVPLHYLKIIKRKYNQSNLLARNVSRLINMPVIHALKRVKNTVPQNNLKYTERQINVKDVFVFNKKISNKIKGKNILLIDDVVTTGSTVNECAKILIEAGANSVSVLCIARAYV